MYVLCSYYVYMKPQANRHVWIQLQLYYNRDLKTLMKYCTPKTINEIKLAEIVQVSCLVITPHYSTWQQY